MSRQTHAQDFCQLNSASFRATSLQKKPNPYPTTCLSCTQWSVGGGLSLRREEKLCRTTVARVNERDPVVGETVVEKYEGGRVSESKIGEL